MEGDICEKVQRVLLQVPATVSEEAVREALQRTSGDELDAICMLLGHVPQPAPKKASQRQAEQEKWNSIREMCDAYDRELEKLIAQSSKST